MKEEWRDVVGYEGYYEVSNLGRVRSVERIHHDSMGRTYSYPSVLRKLQIGTTGYWVVTLRMPGMCKLKKVHRLVLEAFDSAEPKGKQSCHNDGNRLNSRWDNLRWDTIRNNSLDRVKHGTDSRGEQSWNAKLTEDDVRYIHKVYSFRGGNGGKTAVQLAKELDVHENTIYSVTRGQSWEWLDA